MAEFQFKKNLLELTIEGNTFEIDTLMQAQKQQDFIKALEERQKNLGSSPEEVEALCKMILAQVDALLGAGASERIFAGRTVSFYDCVDLYTFISGEIAGFDQEKQNQIRKAGGGRAQRRAK